MESINIVNDDEKRIKIETIEKFQEMDDMNPSITNIAPYTSIGIKGKENTNTDVPTPNNETCDDASTHDQPIKEPSSRIKRNHP